MELSESVTKGLQTLADPNVFDQKSFTIFTEVAFDSLVSSAAESVLGKMALFSLCYMTSGALRSRRKSDKLCYVCSCTIFILGTVFYRIDIANYLPSPLLCVALHMLTQQRIQICLAVLAMLSFDSMNIATLRLFSTKTDCNIVNREHLLDYGHTEVSMQ